MRKPKLVKESLNFLDTNYKFVFANVNGHLMLEQINKCALKLGMGVKIDG